MDSRAYFARVVSYERKMFMKSAPGCCQGQKYSRHIRSVEWRGAQQPGINSIKRFTVVVNYVKQ
jgi:hypothetical protein